ncbi:MAG: DUF192 domain-containing protein [Opitutaceae bacterium]
MKNANPVSSFLRLLAVSVALLAVTGCGRGDAPQAAPKTVADHFAIKVGDQTVQMELAVGMKEMQRGLMGRRDLKPDQGMLFVYDRPQRQSFWMRDTPTPLDVGFFDANGVLAEIYPLYPFDETPVKSRSEALKFALEMNQGWFAAHKVKPGAKLDTQALAAALQARGFDPAAYVKAE